MTPTLRQSRQYLCSKRMWLAVVLQPVAVFERLLLEARLWRLLSPLADQILWKYCEYENNHSTQYLLNEDPIQSLQNRTRRSFHFDLGHPMLRVSPHAAAPQALCVQQRLMPCRLRHPPVTCLCFSTRYRAEQIKVRSDVVFLGGGAGFAAMLWLGRRDVARARAARGL